MAKYYCHGCAAKLGYISRAPEGKVVGSPYQLDKYIKHTVPDPMFAVQSVFEEPSTQAYRTYSLDALAAGAVEIDDAGRKNVIRVAGEQTGFRFEHGQVVQPTDAVKVVLSSNTALMHAYPDNSTRFETATCDQCGVAVVC